MPQSFLRLFDLVERHHHPGFENDRHNQRPSRRMFHDKAFQSCGSSLIIP
jgi:hypothetical protein